VHALPVVSALFHRFLNRQAKIALKAKSEDELLELEAIAKSLNLCARSIEDMLVVNLHNYIVSFLIILLVGA
jgi:peptidyl-tRNA hydrolase